MILFQTKRCIVRSFIQEDIKTVLEYRNNNDWMTYQGFKNKTAQEYMDAFIVPFNIEEDSQLAIADITTNELLGDLYLKQNNTSISVGYTIHPNYARKGYIKEVLLGTIHYLTNTYPTHSIVAETDVLNEASINLLQSVGFKQIKSTNEDLRFKWGD